MTTTKSGALQKCHNLPKNAKGSLFAKDWAEWFLKGNSQIFYINDSDSWSWDFKVEFSPLQSDIAITLLSLIVRVVGSW